tara:strand:+ start:80 stop:1195 length:1116 start_codon:yes stop_codon:yes gene_type:complete
MLHNKKLIAMLGGGQLGLMFVEKAQMMGEKVLVLDPDPDCPAGKIADKFINADYLDSEALRIIIESCSSCTTEFENIPYKTLEILEKEIDVFPKSSALRITQDRILEKKFLNEINILTTEYYEIKSAHELETLNNIQNWPYIIKTSTFGYDGKGQIIVNNYNELIAAHSKLKSDNFVLEKKVELKKEVSQVAAAYDDEIIYLPISENIHINNILHKSLVPADINEDSTEQIKDITKKIIRELNYKGIICIEFFIDMYDNILVNEIAPRAHNSGHYSIEGCSISQFEHQVKIISNQKPENSTLKSPSVMINLLGDLWDKSSPNFDDTNKSVFIHLYNKTTPKKGRKMGHITVLNKNLQSANNIAEEEFKKLS